MSLPPDFTTPEDYFEACMEFLSHYRELYWKANTDVLNDDLSFHTLVEDSVDLFMEEVRRLAPYYEDFTSDNLQNVSSPMSKKKAHEVVHVNQAIHELCEEVGCRTVVDLGAGKGYIGVHMQEHYNYNVLGLELKPTLYVAAKVHQRKYHPTTLPTVKFKLHGVTEHSDTNISTLLEDKFPQSKEFCFVGLHPCGDLTVDAMKLFLKMQDSRALMVTPCCYHRMAPETDNERRFKNFPLSSTFKKIYEDFEGFKFLNVPFLRVASQPNCMKDDTDLRVFYLLARALLTVYARKYNCELKKTKRKALSFPAVKDFTTYAVEVAMKSYRLICNHQKDDEKIIEFNQEELYSMWTNIPDRTFKNASTYIKLQDEMPSVFENLILYDRLQFLKENGVQHCYYRKVVNEKISPKCLSLFACKERLSCT